MYHEYTQEELRSYCRNSIETLELWARRLIHEKMILEHGENFINAKISAEEFLVKKDIRQHVENMLKKESSSSRFQRAVDTLFIEQIIYFLCNPKWYNKLFKTALDYIYPQGVDEAREFLNRLVPIRNPLSHSNPISIRQVEQAICYSHDFVEGLKQYYKERGEEQMWNVPRIIKITDSLGNVIFNPEDKVYGGSVFKIRQPLICGDTYSVEIEMDSSFTNDEYQLVWKLNNKPLKKFDNNPKISITLTEDNIGSSICVRCRVISNKTWHKYQGFDCEITLLISVLPPV